MVSVAGNFIQVRSAFLFEIGEELSVRIEQDGSVSDATARVLAHLGPRDAQITELEIAYSSELEISYPSEPENSYSPDPRPVPSS